jgi:8-amino-7-oxononanoate synthase
MFSVPKSAQTTALAGTPWLNSARVVESAGPGHAHISGRDYIVLCSNDYLGLACEPDVIAAAQAAALRFGAGSRGSRRLGGDTTLHHELETELADFKHTEAALLFSSGFACNLGVIQALVGPGSLVCSDELNHASIVDGCRLSKATLAIYRHLDLDDLTRAIESPVEAKTLIVTDSVFSMEGDVAPLDAIVKLANRHGCSIMLDEAHATGVLGPRGEGSLAHFGLEGSVEILMGTLGKALGSIGGYVAGSRDLIDYVARHARTYLFSTSLPAGDVAAALVALRILRQEPERVRRLWANAELLHDGLKRQGFHVRDHAAPINPILFSDELAAARFSDALFDEGVVVQAVGPPYVPAGQSRLRTIVSAAHGERDISQALAAIAAAAERLGRHNS